MIARDIASAEHAAMELARNAVAIMILASTYAMAAGRVML